MWVDLDLVKPRSETHLHYLLKILGTTFLHITQKCQFVATELDLQTVLPPECGSIVRRRIDALGVRKSSRRYTLIGVEAKTTLTDFKNGYCTLPEYLYVVAPKGVIPVYEIPKNVGLIEFDWTVLNNQQWSITKYEPFFVQRVEQVMSALKVVKDPIEYFHPMFNGRDNRHQEYCQLLISHIAQQNTKEMIRRNPYLVAALHYSKENFSKTMMSEFDINPTTICGLCGERMERSWESQIDEKLWENFHEFTQLVRGNIEQLVSETIRNVFSEATRSLFS
ncbi:MAG: hypothetical protein K6T81_02635 [Alicyclobacillus macrosporangiidus]|uniref:hypothetical protein n=1 Tax=Alicyclobacillus macrosporangiidus TaxID=392015 RepID=UPI0026EF6403|nr:hypothetical protein [Alicyclobacillus macrosporangiidus]MCL6597621.1 hypothetical protein [Alicyclobacillus macrosporangiidus]